MSKRKSWWTSIAGSVVIGLVLALGVLILGHALQAVVRLAIQ